MIPIAIVDDHILIRYALAKHINTFSGYQVILEANNGKDFISQLNTRQLPALVLLDIHMPEMNGFETAIWISRHHPPIKIIVVSMVSDETAIIRMLRSGARGYLTKDAEPEELQLALQTVIDKGIYMNRLLYTHVMPTIYHNPPIQTDEGYLKEIALSKREKEFLQWLCTDKAYKEIAVAMCVSIRTVDGYRDSLFEKLQVASRIGLVTFAIRNQIVQI